MLPSNKIIICLNCRQVERKTWHSKIYSIIFPRGKNRLKVLVAKVIVFLATVTKQQTIFNGSTSEIDQDILKNNHTKYDPFSSM